MFTSLFRFLPRAAPVHVDRFTAESAANDLPADLSVLDTPGHTPGTRPTELWRMGATELAELIRTGQASCREVIEAHLRRIEAVNPRLNAVVLVLSEQALEAAALADRAARGRRPAAGAARGAVHRQGEHRPRRARPPRWGCRRSPRRTRSATHRRSSGCAPPGRSRSGARTVPGWRFAGTPTTSCTARPATPGTGSGPRGLQRRGGRRRRRRHEPAGPGQRRARLAALAGPVLRCGRAEAHPGAHPPRQRRFRPGEPIGAQLTAVQGPMARRVADLPCRPGGARRPDVARPLVGAGTAARTGADDTHPRRRRPRPRRPRHRGPGPRRGAQAADTLASAGGYVLDEVEPPSIDLAARTLLDMLNTPEIRGGYDAFMAAMPTDVQRFIAAFYEVAGPSDPVAPSRASSPGTSCCGLGRVPGGPPADHRTDLHRRPVPGRQRPRRRRRRHDHPRHAHGHRGQRARVCPPWPCPSASATGCPRWCR
jgi:amidase